MRLKTLPEDLPEEDALEIVEEVEEERNQTLIIIRRRGP